jgi:hypothetical protein
MSVGKSQEQTPSIFVAGSQVDEYIHQGDRKLREIKAASGRRSGLNWIWFRLPFHPDVTLGYTSGYLQVRGVDNCLPVSPLAVCECRAGTWVEEKGYRLEVCLTRRYSVYS